MISAQEAERLGMINRVVPHDQLMRECEKTARKLVKIAQVGVKFNKAAINRAYENMGFLNSIYQNLDLVVMFDTTRTQEQGNIQPDPEGKRPARRARLARRAVQGRRLTMPERFTPGCRPVVTLLSCRT